MARFNKSKTVHIWYSFGQYLQRFYTYDLRHQFFRQVTDYDQTCLKLDEKGETLGSRVFGDCDKLMREVMRRILPKEERVKWEEDRSVRMLTYDTQRKL